MSFLAPLFLAGAAAITLPLIFHLIRRSSREKVLFSSLMFLSPSPPEISKKSRLQHILLLIVRSLVVILLALAFARPFIRKATPAAAKPALSHRIALLIDTSASMRRPKLWNGAVQKALARARATQPQDQFAVFLFDRQVRSLLNFNEASGLSPAERERTLQSRLGGLEPSWSSTHFGNALIGAAQALIDSGNKDTNDLASAQIVLISDMQAGARMEGLQGFEWPKRFAVTLDPVEAEAAANASLQILEDSTHGSSMTTNLPIRLRVQNNPLSKKEQFEVSWATEAGSVGEKMNIYVPAGQSRTAVAPPLPAGQKPDRLVLTGDDVPFDNTVFFVPPHLAKINIAFLGSDAAADANGSLYYLKRAFEPAGTNTIQVKAWETEFSLNPGDTALAVATRGLSSDQAGFARQLLEQGKTLFVAAHDVETINGLKLLVGSQLGAKEGEVRNYAMLGQIDFNHPLFSPFADARFSDFTKIHFWKYRALEWGGLTNATVAARFDSGEPALVEFQVGRGRVLVLATTWMPEDSQLALSSKFVPLLFTILERSADIRNEQHQFTVGDSIPLTMDGKPAMQIHGPNGTKELAAGETQFNGADAPGIYKAMANKNGAMEPVFDFAVNIDPAEGKLGPMAPDDFQNLGVPISAPVTAPVDPALAAKKQQHVLDSELEAHQRLWHDLIFAGTMLVLLETWVAMRASRNSQVLTA